MAILKRMQPKKNRPVNSALGIRAKELIGREIAFVFRPAPGESPTPVIDDLDEFIAGVSANPSAGRARAELRSNGLLPVTNQLLTSEQESSLFLQMNFLKFRANALRSRLNPDRPSESRIDEIDKSLAEAERIRNLLCEFNLRLVLSIARKLSHSQNQFEEFVSEGFPVLMRCVELFDASRGYRFSTYVTHAVQRHLYRVLQRTQRRKKKLAPTDSEILANVAGPDAEPDIDVDHNGLCEQILQAGFDQLDDREQFIVNRRFGFGGKKSQTLRQIAVALGISKERVRQLQLRAIEKLHDVATSLNLSFA